MKIKNAFPISMILLVGLLGSCNKEADPTSLDPTLSPGSSSNLKSQQLPNDSGLKSVDLGVAGDFAILSKTGITDVYKSDVTGDIGSSPITGAAVLLTCAEVTGTIYTVDAAGPLPCRVTNATRLGTAVLNMQTAYTDAAGRSKPDFLNLGAGNI